MSLSSQKEFSCPYCGSPNEITLDGGQGQRYELVTDCETCCRPIIVRVRVTDGACELEVHAENE